MFAGAVLGGVAGQRRHRVLDLAGLEVALAPLVALVAAGLFPAVGTGPFDVAVGEGLVLLGVPGDLDLLLVDVVVFDPRADELLGEFDVGLVVGVPVVVELDVELRERLGVGLVEVKRELPRLDTLLGGVDRYRCTVHVRPRNERRLLADPSEGARQRVPVDVRPEVADVQVTVRVGQPTGHDRRLVRRKLVVAHTCSCATDGSKGGWFRRRAGRAAVRQSSSSRPPKATNPVITRSTSLCSSSERGRESSAAPNSGSTSRRTFHSRGPVSRSRRRWSSC